MFVFIYFAFEEYMYLYALIYLVNTIFKYRRLRIHVNNGRPLTMSRSLKNTIYDVHADKTHRGTIREHDKYLLRAMAKINTLSRYAVLPFRHKEENS